MEVRTRKFTLCMLDTHSRKKELAGKTQYKLMIRINRQDRAAQFPTPLCMAILAHRWLEAEYEESELRGTQSFNFSIPSGITREYRELFLRDVARYTRLVQTHPRTKKCGIRMPRVHKK